MLAALPATVTSLNLADNEFNKKTHTELADLFAALPATVTTLNLSGDIFNTFNAEQIDAIMGALPLGVESIILRDKVIHTNMYYVNQLLKNHPGHYTKWNSAMCF